ncbi:LOB domain-containing protein 25 [Striga hermonthica]|uniref:LOB domain-containing protein 25 n=1 Tax=Striga hermonthica TaxID=68872 RepID=A0A9N7RAR0_STRHE|nr:LOB domain-containing protein 25 [Striga hermonthica]
MAPSSSYSNPPCGACKFLRRKCLPSCVFAPYFPPEDPTKFINVHRIFGASNVIKLLNEIPLHHRDDAVNSLAYEAEARLKDPIYGCVGAISALQRQLIALQRELDAINADIIRFSNNDVVGPYGAFGRRANPGSGYYDPCNGFLWPYTNWGWNAMVNDGSNKASDNDRAGDNGWS